MVSPRTQLLPRKSQPQTHWRWRQAKRTPAEAQNPHVRKQRQKTPQNKWWEGDAAAIYLLWSVQGIVLSKERTSFRLLWKSHSGSWTLVLEGQCQPRQSCWHQPQQGGTNSSCVRTRRWRFPVSDQCRSYPCPGLASLPESWPEPHSTSATIISHPHANHQNNAKLQLNQFCWWSRYIFFKSQKT